VPGVTSSSPVSVLRAGALSDAEADQVDGILDDAATEDGAGPLSEEARLRLRGAQDGGIHLLLHAPDQDRIVGYAQLAAEPGSHDARAELVVAPGYRRRHLGRALASALLEDANGRTLHVWAHGDHPGARRLADECGFVRERDLWQMRRPLDQPLPEPTIPSDLTIRAFVPGRDEAAWLAVNATAFASHPEQGSWTGRDLRLREAEPWFDPAGFFLAERGGQLVGFHWTKVHPATPVEPALGEVYVLGVLPSEAGRGLGGLLTLIGLRHLQAAGLGTVLLYVEATNAAAVAVYERLGFSRFAVDVSYRSARGEGLPAAGSRLGSSPVDRTGTVLAEVDMTDSTTSPDVVDILTIDHREALDLIQ
jgi:mycothiol synthase